MVLNVVSLNMDELARAVQLGGKQLMERVSWSDIFAISYEAGGVYPTLVGYALGSIAMLCLIRGSSWMIRLVPAAICTVLLLHTRNDIERKNFEWLLVVSAVTGVCCTYVQLASLDLVREHIAFKTTPTKKKKMQ